MLSKNISIGRGSQTLTELSCWRRKWVFKSFPAKKRRIHVWKWQENTSVWQVWNFKCRKNTNVCPSLNFRNCWTYFTDSITQCKSKIICVHMFISVYAFRGYISIYLLTLYKSLISVQCDYAAHLDIHLTLPCASLCSWWDFPRGLCMKPLLQHLLSVSYLYLLIHPKLASVIIPLTIACISDDYN